MHAGAERSVCNIVVSTETPQTTTNPSQTLFPMYKLAYLPLPSPSPHLQDPTAFSSAFLRRCATDVIIRSCPSGPNILDVYIIYLHVYMCQYIRVCHLSHVPRLRLACAFLKFHQNFHVLTHIYM